jgi:hypothetical protein
MSHPAPSTGPWRVVILDRDPADPKLILALVVDPSDVTPAWPGTGPHAMAEATVWVRSQLGRSHATLTPLTRPDVWRVDENRQEYG